MKKTTNRWIALVAMSLGVFMGLLDVTVVNVALPSMAVDFKTTFSNLQWVLNAYTLMYAVSLLIVSKLGDMFGRKKIFIMSMILFTAASVVNGLAPNLLVLDIGRAIQAIGGSGMMSLSMALVASNFEGRERGTALGILGSVIGFSTAIGPLVGGFLVESFGWPSIFFVNLPVGIISVYLVIRNVKETPAYGAGESIDFMGMFLSAIGFILRDLWLNSKRTTHALGLDRHADYGVVSRFRFDSSALRFCGIESQSTNDELDVTYKSPFRGCCDFGLLIRGWDLCLSRLSNEFDAKLYGIFSLFNWGPSIANESMVTCLGTIHRGIRL